MALLLRVSQKPLHERRWGAETVVFDTYSGETHYLNLLASAIFHRVDAAGMVDLDLICAEFAAAANGGFEPEDIGSAAARLCRIGLMRVENSEG
jgi:PqqD family protein of HPr-rel-A system